MKAMGVIHMSLIEKIIFEIDELSNNERSKLFQHLMEKYTQQHCFVVGENYDFWINNKDSAYDEPT